MTYDAEQDPYCYPGSSVLVNLGDIRDQRDLDEFELSMFLSRADEPLPGGDLDYRHYREIHRHLFQDVYSWAGEPRTVRIAKGGNWFCYPENLDSFMSRAFLRLAEQGYLAGRTATGFAHCAAEILADINAGHPFREGNGRTQLTFLKLLAFNADLPFNEAAIRPDETLRAMIASFGGDLRPLTVLVERIIDA